MAAREKMETRDKILETAFLLYIRKGFTNVSMSDLLSKSGLTKGGFYYYFESKDELIAEVMKKYLFSYYDEVMSYILNYDGSPKEKLRMLFFSTPGIYSDYMQFRQIQVENKAVDFRSFYLLLMDGVQKYEIIAEYYEDFHLKLIEFIRQIIEDCKKQGSIPADVDSDQMARFVHACLQGTIFMWVVVPHIDMKETLGYNFNRACQCIGLE